MSCSCGNKTIPLTKASWTGKGYLSQSDPFYPEFETGVLRAEGPCLMARLSRVALCLYSICGVRSKGGRHTSRNEEAFPETHHYFCHFLLFVQQTEKYLLIRFLSESPLVGFHMLSGLEVKTHMEYVITEEFN